MIRLIGIAIMAVLSLALASVVAVAGAVTLTPLPPPELPEATELYDVNGQLISRLFQENRVEVALSAIPRELRDALIAAEDERFYRHRGVDLRGVARAAVRNIMARKKVEGGSTITQQLARNLYLSHERTWTRKIREAILALKLEASYSKDEILSMYLNTIYLGQGAYGVEVASQTYFGKHVQDLSLAEAALLAGLPRGPELYNPFTNPDLAVDRRNTVLQRMVEAGYLSQQAADAAAAEPLELAPPRPVGGEAAYFVAHVQEQIAQHHPAIAEDLKAGGYRIHTTLDLQVQRAAHRALVDGLPQARADAEGVLQPQGAIVAMDPRTGAIRAMVGGRDYTNSPYNRATNALRQPGSAFKPFLYATLLSTQYFTAASTQMCEYVEFPGGRGREPWRPTDFDPRNPYHNHPMGMRDAIRVSDNVIAARWMDVIKPDRVIDTAHRLGIQSALTKDLTLALGTSEVTVLEMTRAFAAFANGGYRVEPISILRITDARGTVLVENQPRAAKVLDERVAYILTDLLQEVIRPGGTAGQVGRMVNRPAAGKTGTTENSQDVWFVGYTPDLVAAVWAGNDDPNRPLPGRLTASQLAAPIWGDLMARALSGRPATAFVRPPGITEAEVCTDSGLLATPFCPSRRELFIAGTEPTEVDPRAPLWLPGMPGEAPDGVPGEPGGVPGEPGGVPGEPGGVPGEPGGVPEQPGNPDETAPGAEPELRARPVITETDIWWRR